MDKIQTHKFLNVINGKNEVHTVLVSHIHAFDKTVVKGVKYVLSGGAGALLVKEQFPNARYHVIALSTIPAGIPGGYNRVIGSLWCKVQLKSFYVGKDNVIYLNVSNIKEAIEILSQKNLLSYFLYIGGWQYGSFVAEYKASQMIL